MCGQHDASRPGCRLPGPGRRPTQSPGSPARQAVLDQRDQRLKISEIAANLRVDPHRKAVLDKVGQEYDSLRRLQAFAEVIDVQARRGSRFRRAVAGAGGRG